MNKVALITGISGQDGSYLSEYLLELGYEVHGIVRRSSIVENQFHRIEHIIERINIHYGDLLDEYSLLNIIDKVKPDEIYNLAAMSHVGISFEMPSFTFKVNSLGVLNMLEIIRTRYPYIKFYQAGSSEMFGNNIDDDLFQRLTTAMKPVSPYGCSKLAGYNLTKQYRDSYNLHACNGILFNHESPRRGTNFVTNKIVKAAVEIKLGYKEKIELGNLDSCRDWGHSYDYVRAIHMILNYHVADDWIVSTGETRSVKDLCEYTFSSLDLNYKDYVIQNPKYFRKKELNNLCGDSSKIRNVLGWKPKYTFEAMIDEMIRYWFGVIAIK